MGNRVIRVVLGIILAAAALVGVYFILPGGIKHPIQEKIQSWFMKDKYETVEYLKKQKVPGTERTFEDTINGCGSNGSWYIDVANVGDDGKSGDYEVHAFVTKVDISMAQENGQENLKSYSQSTVDIQFNVRRKVGEEKEFTVLSYIVTIDEEPQNQFYSAEALKSMAKKAKAVDSSEATTAAE
jgi:hypothetical protein